MLPYLEKEVKKRKTQAEGKPRGEKQVSLSAEMHHEKGRSDVKAGRLLGISGRIVSDAKMIKEIALEKFEEIKDGKSPTKTVGKKTYAPNEKSSRNLPSSPCAAS